MADICRRTECVPSCCHLDSRASVCRPILHPFPIETRRLDVCARVGVSIIRCGELRGLLVASGHARFGDAMARLSSTSPQPARIESLTAFYMHPFDGIAATLINAICAYGVFGSTAAGAGWGL